MYKKMLVPLDGSELAEAVLPHAKELAGRLDLDVVFLHVCSSQEHTLAAMHRVYVEHMAETIEHQVREVQQRTDIQAKDKGVKVRGELAAGYPAEEILRYADKNAIDLILMATHGYSGITRWTIGSVADKVLRAAKIPVWLVRVGVAGETAYDKWPRRTILVPLDGSKLAEVVLPHVEALAKQRSPEPLDIVLLRVCPPPMVIPSERSPSIHLSWEKYVEQEITRCRQESEEYLAGIKERLKNINIKVRTEVLVGKPADEIIDYAHKNPFTVIVMATHGYAGLSRWAYGSVADKILHGASRPIFLVRPH